MKIVLAVIIFSLIVIFHEFGHLLFAKKNGIKVLEFSVGLGPTIVGKEFHGTKYSIKALPFGGACQMLGEDVDMETKEEGSFYSKSVWARMQVVLAGPFFNFILAFVLAVITIAIGGTDPSYVTAVDKDSSAYAQGIREGDRVLSVDGHSIHLGRDLYLYEAYDLASVEPIDVTVKRNGEKIKVQIEPVKDERYLLGFRYNSNEDALVVSEIISGYAFERAGIKAGDKIVAVNGTNINSGAELTAYFSKNSLSTETVKVSYERNGQTTEVELKPEISVSYNLGFNYQVNAVRVGFLDTIGYSFTEVGFQIKTTVKSLGMLFSGRVKANELGGAIAIVDQIGDTYETTKKAGASGIQILAVMLSISLFLSTNLGVMNLLPIPALDGGKFLLLIVEAIKRKPLNRKVEGIVNFTGFMLLMLLMVLVLFNDIRRLIFG